MSQDHTWSGPSATSSGADPGRVGGLGAALADLVRGAITRYMLDTEAR